MPSTKIARPKNPKSKPWHVYLVRCSDGSIYTGITPDVEARIRKHNGGTGAKYTASRGPVTLMYQEKHGDRGGAMRREAEIKCWPKARKEKLASPKKRAPSAKSPRQSPFAKSFPPTSTSLITPFRPGLRSRLWLYFFCHLGICSIFIAKYGVRYGVGPVLGSIGYAVIVTILVAAFARLPRLRQPQTPAQALWLSVALTALLGLFMYQFDVEFIRNNRHASLDLTVGRLLNGEYPYMGPTFSLHSGLPVWLLLATPLYLIGDTGLLIVCGLPLFSWALWRLGRRDWAMGILLLVTSPQFLYETAARSEIFVNMCLFLAALLIIERARNNGSLISLILSGAVSGAALSTRAVTWVVFLIYLGYVSSTSWRQVRVIGISALIVLLLSIAPFAVWNWEQFATVGPIVHQIGLSGLPLWVLAVALLLPFLLGRFARSMESVMEVSAALLLLIVTLACLNSIRIQGVYAAIIQSGFDITYLIFPLPFMLILISELMPGNGLTHTHRSG